MDKINLVKCHFTLEELIYLKDLIKRDRIFSEFVYDQIRSLKPLGVELLIVEPPNMVGKLGSYIKKGAIIENA